MLLPAIVLIDHILLIRLVLIRTMDHILLMNLIRPIHREAVIPEEVLHLAPAAGALMAEVPMAVILMILLLEVLHRAELLQELLRELLQEHQQVLPQD